MSLSPGVRFGSYEVLGPLGAGGMGEVYRARDTRLNRLVALKILPDTFDKDPDRLARFAREAQSLAALNHPHIAQIYAVEDRAIVMELVDGEDLSQRLTRGPMPIDEALPAARQIAEALEAAHDHGIIHRDLKPANIKLRDDGTVKVLDFGLAKALVGADSTVRSEAVAAANSPTLSLHATQAGIILGTAAYMSPEQARGKTVDRRADIWALGCVLFEMLTGARAFRGDDATDTIVAIVSKDPDWNSLPHTVPDPIRRLLRRSLEKDARRRLDSAAAVRLEIDEALNAPQSDVHVASHAPGKKRWIQLLPWGISGALASALLVFASLPPRAPASTGPVQPPIRLLLGQVSASTGVASFAIAPDGGRIVYVAGGIGSRQLYLRDMSSVEATPIAGTEGASTPFFSPDGQRIGFFSGGKLRVMALAGGAPLVLADAQIGRGGAWAPDDTVIYSPATDAGLWQVPAGGGTPQPLAEPDSTKGERSYRWPEILPGGDAVLFTVAMSDILSFDDARLVVRSLRTGEQREVVRGGSFGRYAATGQLLYARAGALLAAPFDRAQLKVTGTPRPVLDGVVTDPLAGVAQYALSANGTLLYLAGRSESQLATLSWVSRTGQTTPLAVPPAAFQGVSVSPDGSRAAVDIDGANASIWILDLDRTAMTRLTLEWSNNGGFWTPDGTRVAYTSARSGIRSLYWQRVDNQGGPEPVFPLGQLTAQVATAAWVPDGQTVIFDALSPRTGRDLWVARLDGDRVPRPLLQTSFNESSASVSPDGRWLAYVSNETGTNEVYVQPYPGPGRKTRISADGGAAPNWSRDGDELFFRNGDALMGAIVGPSISPQTPRLLFRTGSRLPLGGGLPYGIGRDGRFLMIDPVPSSLAARPVTMVVNWFEEMKKVLATGAGPH